MPRQKDEIIEFVQAQGVAIKCDIHRHMRDQGATRATTTKNLWELVNEEAILERDGYRYWLADGDAQGDWDLT